MTLCFLFRARWYLFCVLVVAYCLDGVSRRAPAWVALQHIGPGQKWGSPACLATLTKVPVPSKKGLGWRLASYTDDTRNRFFTVDLQLDRNPDEPCCKLCFTDKSLNSRVGHMLLSCGEHESKLRGMWIEKDLRGQGLSRLLLAVWLRMCTEANLTPTTHIINKPLLSLTLAKFGFTPHHGLGKAALYGGSGGVMIAPKGRALFKKVFKDVKRVSIAPRELSKNSSTKVAYVQTAFAPPEPLLLAKAVDIELQNRLSLAASSVELRHALTLRVAG